MKSLTALLKIVLGLLLLFVALFAYAFIYLNESIEPPTSIKIEKGSNQKALESIEKVGISVNVLDTIVLKILGGAKSGNISLEGVKNRLELLKAINKGKQQSMNITLIPGETTEMFLRNLAKKESLSLDKLKSAYYRKTSSPEGALWPQTYSLMIGSNEEAVINEIFEFSQKKFEELREQKQISKEELEKKVVIASIIEKEAASKEEMPLVASVIYNRLKIGMPLQMDGTLNYGIYSHQKVTPQRIREDDSSYNTYKNRGLPPYPVCNPSREALEAAFSPASTDFLYFMKSREGRHNFSNSYTEHKSNINDVKKSNR